jgi:hypothetical protein
MVKTRQIIIVSLVLFTILGCSDPSLTDKVGQHPAGLGSYSEIGYYTFDSETIFTSLNQGEIDLFQTMSAPADDNLFPSGSFSWRQTDYLKIANALNQFVRKDTLDNWEVYSMFFYRDCGDNPIGFDRAHITYFKTAGKQYTAREMDIYPLAKEADWGGNTDFPRPFLFGWKRIDLEKLKITADDALQMAETNGGKDARLAAKNECRIYVSLAPNTHDDSWDVDYIGASHIFQMIVDPYSGAYEILFPKK